MREFVTAVNEAYPEEQEVEEGSTLLLDGKQLRYYKPAEGQYMVFMASTSRHSSSNEQVAGVVNFFIGLFDDESQTYLTERLMDRKDPFGIEMINQMLDAMTEEWTGRPTKSSTASSRSPKTGGRKSTRPIQALTSSENRSTGS